MQESPPLGQSEDDILLEARPRERDLIVIPDLHGNSPLFENTLVRTGVIRVEGGRRLVITEEGRNVDIVQNGDVVGRGRDALRILDRIASLQRAGVRIVMNLGNHEWEFLKAFHQNDLGLFLRQFNMKQGGVPLLEEILRRVSPESDHLDVHCDSDDTEDSDTILECDDIRVTMNRLMLRLRQALCDSGSPSGSVLAKARWATRFGDALCVHASVDENVLKVMADGGIDALDERFEGSLLWGRSSNGKLVTETTGQMLRDQGIRLLIRGHEPVVIRANMERVIGLGRVQTREKVQRCVHDPHNCGAYVRSEHGVWVVHGDTRAWESSDPGAFHYARVRPDGWVEVASSPRLNQRWFHVDQPPTEPLRVSPPPAPR